MYPNQVVGEAIARLSTQRSFLRVIFGRSLTRSDLTGEGICALRDDIHRACPRFYVPEAGSRVECRHMLPAARFQLACHAASETILMGCMRGGADHPLLAAMAAIHGVFTGDDTALAPYEDGSGLMDVAPYWIYCDTPRAWFESLTAKARRFVTGCALMNLAERGHVSSLLREGLHRGVDLPPGPAAVAAVMDGAPGLPKLMKSRLEQRVATLLALTLRAGTPLPPRALEDCEEMLERLGQGRYAVAMSAERRCGLELLTAALAFTRGDGQGNTAPRLRERVRDPAPRGDQACLAGVPGCRALLALDALRRRDEAAARGYVRMAPAREDRNILSVLLFHAARLRLGLSGSADAAVLEDWRARLAHLPLYDTMARGLLAAMRPGQALPEAPALRSPAGNWLDLTGLVPDIPLWEERLKRLERAAAAPGEAATRLVWVADPDSDNLALYEQKRLARGGWSPGRQVRLSQFTLIQLRGNPALAPEDLAVLGRLSTSGFGLFGQRERLSAVADALVGHPRVMERVAGKLVPVAVTRGRAELRVQQDPNTGSCSLALADERLAAAVASGDAASGSPVLRGADGGLVVYSLTPVERGMVAALADRLEFPARVLDRVLGAVRESAGLRVRVEVDAEDVKADTTIIIQLEQQGEAFLASFGVRPFGRPGTPLLPVGQGSEAPIISSVQAGRQAGNGAAGARPARAQRDFEAERLALDALAAACPTLEAHRYENRWEGGVEEALRLLEELAECDVPCQVEWPRGQSVRVTRPLGPEAVKARIGRGTGMDWFGLSGELLLPEGRVLTLQALISSFTGSRFVRLSGGEYVALTRELRGRVAKLKAVAVERRGGLQVTPLLAGAVEDALEGTEVDADPQWAASVERMRAAFASIPEVPAPLRATLRDYQREGYVWLQRLANWGVGACLADDMGLGKTVQAIAVMLNQAARGPCLVLAPTSVCGNWEQELVRFAPSLSARRMPQRGREAFVRGLGPGDVLVMGYGLLPRVGRDLASRDWAMAVFDEAQALKNADTKRARAGRRVTAAFPLALTGTPIENRVDDLWSLFSIINPGLLGSWDSFRKRFGAAAPGTGARRALRALVRPFLLRRLKSAVLDELPPRVEQTIVVEPTDRELVFYNGLRERIVDRVALGDGQGRFEILAALTKLRLACCHPGLADPDMAGLVRESAKTRRFAEMVEDLVAGGHKVLAFSQFTSYLALVREALETRRVRCHYLDGQTPEAERRALVSSFQKGEGDVFLLSLRAGGTGLNLTAADYVFHLDPWWNPAVEDQASDRAHRIGQERPVTIYRLVMAHSVEEKILTLHGAKRELAADFLSGTGAAVKGLTDQELLALLRDR